MSYEVMFQTLWPLLQNLSDVDLDAIHTALNPPWDSAREAREAYKPLIRAIQEAMARLPHYRDTHYSKTAGRQWWIEPPFPLQHIQGQIGFSMKKRQMSPDHPPSMVFDLIGRIRFAPTDAWLSIGHFNGRLNPHRLGPDASGQHSAKELKPTIIALDSACDPQREPFKRFQAIHQTLISTGGDALPIHEWLEHHTPHFGHLSREYLNHVVIPRHHPHLAPAPESAGWSVLHDVAPSNWRAAEDGEPMALTLNLQDDKRWRIEAEGTLATYVVGSCQRLSEAPALISTFRDSHKGLNTARDDSPREAFRPMKVEEVMQSLHKRIQHPTSLDLRAIRDVIVPDKQSAYSSPAELRLIFRHLHDLLEGLPNHRETEQRGFFVTQWWYASQRPAVNFQHQLGIACTHSTRRLDADLDLTMTWHGRVRFREIDPWIDLHLFLKREKRWGQSEQWTDPALNLSNFGVSSERARLKQLSHQLTLLDQLATQRPDLLAGFLSIHERMSESDDSCATALEWMLEHHERFGLFTQRYFHTAVVPRRHPMMIADPERDPPSVETDNGPLLSWTLAEDASTLFPIISLTHEGWSIEVEGNKTNYELGLFAVLNDALMALREAEENPHHDFATRQN